MSCQIVYSVTGDYDEVILVADRLKACCFCSASSADATTFVFVLLLQLQYTLLQKRVYRVYYKGSVQCTVQSSVKAATRKEVTP